MQFPLEKYDESGRLKPPLFFYVGLVFLCRSVLLLIVALSLRGQSDQVMAVFYPSQREFYLSLSTAIVAAYLLFIVSRRNSLWLSQRNLHFKLLKPMSFIAVITDIALQLYILSLHQFAFSVNKVITLTFAFVFLAYLMTNPLMKTLVSDWQKEV
ncbi:MAG: DUF2919 domain-containing protein [Pseudomonadota bacterium]